MTKKYVPLSGVDPVVLRTVIPIKKDNCPTLMNRHDYGRDDDNGDKAFQDLNWDAPDDSAPFLDIEYKE